MEFELNLTLNICKTVTPMKYNNQYQYYNMYTANDFK